MHADKRRFLAAAKTKEASRSAYGRDVSLICVHLRLSAVINTILSHSSLACFDLRLSSANKNAPDRSVRGVGVLPDMSRRTLESCRWFAVPSHQDRGQLSGNRHIW